MLEYELNFTVAIKTQVKFCEVTDYVVYYDPVISESNIES